MASRACPLGFAPARSAVLDASRVARSHLEGTNVAPSLAEAWAKISLPSLSLPSVATLTNSCTVFPTSNKLKGLVRLGVPHEVRPSLWFLLSGGHSLSEQAEPGTYARLSTSTSDLSPTMLLADTLNLSLTWRPHPAFQNPDFAAAIARILIALLAHNPCLNYSRHLCHVTAFLLLVFGGVQHEEAVFYTLAAMMDKLLFPHVNGQWATGTRIEATVLDRLAARKLPHLASHLATLDLSVASLAAPWLSSLFIGVLPSIPLLRVWDCMLCEGLKMVQRTGLALLLMCEKPLTSCSHPDVLRRVVALRVGGITSADELLATAFRGVRSFPGAAIIVIRSDATRGVLEGSGQGRDRLAKVSDGSSGPPYRSFRSAGGDGGSSPSGVSATPSRDVSPRFLVWECAGALALVT
mmetsp:Transcript_8697/g.15036  ORF Transcript_8697/g.15036 Transcript_8697/m.15036 type:complete len:409 (-) Transcript_8697:742-1968(-)